MNVALPKPVHLVSGFLGSGKTTLINRLLRSPAFKHAGVIVNELSETSLDHHFVQTGFGSAYELAADCLCCGMLDELADVLVSVSGTPCERILVEASGVADPSPILRVFDARPELRKCLRLGATFAAFDVLQGEQTIENQPEVARQLALADVVWLTKSDLIEPKRQAEALAKAELLIGRINSAARVLMPEHMESLTSADLERSEGLVPEKLEPMENHASRFANTVFRTTNAVEEDLVYAFFDRVLSTHARSFLRMKGLIKLRDDPSRPAVFQSSGQMLHPVQRLDSWPSSGDETTLVAISDQPILSDVETLFDGFFGNLNPGGPDRQALIDNPLAIPGNSL